MTINELVDKTSALLEETNKNEPLACWNEDTEKCHQTTRHGRFHYSWPPTKLADQLCPACRANYLVSLARNAMIECANRR